jgi:hypothetical protein
MPERIRLSREKGWRMPLAEEKGWSLPSTNNTFPSDAWNRYWAAKEEYERNPGKGRPIPPHRSG